MTETGMYLWMSSPLISGGPFLSLQCSARVRPCLCLLVLVVDWYATGWQADLLPDHFDRPGSRAICRSLVIRLLFLPPFPSGGVRSGVYCYTWTIMVALTHWGLLMLYPPTPRLSVVFRRLVCLGSSPACWRQADVTRFRKVHRPPL